MRGLYIGGGNEFVTFAEAQRRLGGSQHKGLSEHIATRDRSPDFNYLGSFLPNPDAILKRMGKDVEVYRQLRADAHTGGCIRRRKAAVKSLEWRINRNKAGARVTRIVEDVFGRLDLDTIINEMLDAVLYGFQPLEVMWARGKGGAPQPWDIVGKPPEWFLFDTDAELRFRSRAKWTEGEPLAARKFLLAQQEATYANPYGFADLSMCFWPVTFKKGGLRYWVKFAEKYGMPWAVGKQPRNSPQAETNKLLDQLEAMIEDAVAVIPDDASVEMLQAARLAFVPEDRLGMGLVSSMGMTDNMMLRSYRHGHGFFSERKQPRELAETIMKELEVVTPSVEWPVGRMSGGNVQKVLVGREIASSPQVLMVAYPVRGLDINTSYTIYHLLNEQKKRGVAVIYVGEDLDVLLELCDRIVVLCGGKVNGVLDGRKTTKEEVGLRMTNMVKEEQA